MKKSLFGALTLASVLLAGCATAAPDHTDPRMFKKIGTKEGCEVFQTYDAPNERNYRVDCPRNGSAYVHDVAKTVTLAPGDPRVKCRVTYAVSSQPAHDYNNFNDKWVSATTIKCWGPRVPGDL